MLRLQRVARGAPSALVVGICALSVFAAVQACGGAMLGENRDDSASGAQGDGEDDEWCTSSRGGYRYRCGGTRGSGRRGGGSGRCSGRGC